MSVWRTAGRYPVQTGRPRTPGLAAVCAAVLALPVGVLPAAATGDPATSQGLPVVPQPVGMSTVTVSYDADGSEVSHSGQRSFTGTSPGAATELGVDSNIRVFQSANGFGRRLSVSNQFPQVLPEHETLIGHNFFNQANGDEFFPGVAADGDVTFHFNGIQFDRPVFVDENTFMLHLLWDSNQSRLLSPPYDNVQNLHTLTDPLRDAVEFEMANEFEFLPAPHQAFGDLAGLVQIDGEGTSELSLRIDLPYSLLEHLADEDNSIPAGLPAPHGFLEPFHFHFEYVVTAVPESGSLILLGFGGGLMLRRRRHRA